MPEITKEEIRKIVKMQQIETDIRRLQVVLEKLPDKISGLDAGLDQAEKVIAESEKLLKAKRQQYRDYETDIDINSSQIKKSEQKLGSVKNNKEYQSSLKEIDELKVKNSCIEDEMILCLDSIENIERDLKSNSENYNKIVKKINLEKDALKNQSENDEQKLLTLYAERDDNRESIQPGLLKKFLIIQKNQTNGVAIAQVKNSVCFGCNMNIPPQIYNTLQRCNSLEFCPFCNRILYWEQPQE